MICKRSKERIVVKCKYRENNFQWIQNDTEHRMMHFKSYCFQRTAGSLYMLKILSISAITSLGKGRSVVMKASMSSFSWSKEVAPMIELVLNGWSLANPRAS